MKNLLKRLYRSKTNIDKKEMQEILQNNENAILLDVRSPQEFEEGHFPGAINIPNYELYYKAPRKIKDKETIIIAYCTLGLRSKKSAKILKKMGYKNIYHLDGGIG